jgi:hypothetical protein
VNIDHASCHSIMYVVERVMHAGARHDHSVGIAALRSLARRKAQSLHSADAAAAVASSRVADAMERRTLRVDLTGVLFTATVAVLLRQSLCGRNSAGKRPVIEELILVNCGAIDYIAAELLAATIRDAKGIQRVQLGGDTQLPSDIAAEIEQFTAAQRTRMELENRERGARAMARAQVQIRDSCVKILGMLEGVEADARRSLIAEQVVARTVVLNLQRTDLATVAATMKRSERLAAIAINMAELQATEHRVRGTMQMAAERAILALSELFCAAARASVIRAQEAERNEMREACRWGWSFARRAEKIRFQSEFEERDTVETAEGNERRVIEQAEARRWPEVERAAFASLAQALHDQQKRMENAARAEAARKRVEDLARDLKQREAADRAAHAEAVALIQRQQRDVFDAEALSSRAKLRDHSMAVMHTVLKEFLADLVFWGLREAAVFASEIRSVEAAIAAAPPPQLVLSGVPLARDAHGGSSGAEPRTVWAGDELRTTLFPQPIALTAELTPAWTASVATTRDKAAAKGAALVNTLRAKVVRFVGFFAVEAVRSPAGSTAKSSRVEPQTPPPPPLGDSVAVGIVRSSSSVTQSPTASAIECGSSLFHALHSERALADLMAPCLDAAETPR